MRFERLEERALLATIVVDSLGDGTVDWTDGEVTLRDALAWAADSTRPGPDEIVFSRSLQLDDTPGEIRLGRRPLSINSDVMIRGPGASQLTIDAGGQTRVVVVRSGVRAEINGIALTNGVADYRGGGLYNAGNLVLSRVSVTRSKTRYWSAAPRSFDGGGGIFNEGTLTVVDSVIRNNYSGDEGGGIYTVPDGRSKVSGLMRLIDSQVTANSTRWGGGGIMVENGATLSVDGSVISDNRASRGGGATLNGRADISNSLVVGNSAASRGGGGGLLLGRGEYRIVNSTIANNVASVWGGGLAIDEGSVFIGNSIVTDNDAPTGSDIHGSFGEASSIIGRVAGFVDAANGDYRLRSDSPAVNAGENDLAVNSRNDTLAWDVRGEPFPRIVGGTVDVGAFESTVDDRIFEILARSIVYLDCPFEKRATCDPEDPTTQWKKGDRVTLNGEDLGYVVDRPFYGAKGFFALGLMSREKGPALAIRGTEVSSLADWWTDVDPKGVGYSQFIANWKSIQKWVNEIEEAGYGPVDIVGHSLGGALSQWVAARLTSDKRRIDEVVTFNSPGISNKTSPHDNLVVYASDFVSTNATRVVHYVVNGDVVTLAGDAFIEGPVQTATYRTWNPFNKHSLPLMVPELEVVRSGRVSTRRRPRNIEWKRDTSTTELNKSSYGFDDRDYKVWLLGLKVAVDSSCAAHPVSCLLLPDVDALRQRGTVESWRDRMGQGLRIPTSAFRFLEAGFRLVEPKLDTYRLFITEQAMRFFDALTVSLVPKTVDWISGIDGTRVLTAIGMVALDMQKDIRIVLPNWLGGSIKTNQFVGLQDQDDGAVLDTNKVIVDGKLQLLGDLIQIYGQAEVAWSQRDLSVAGPATIGNGFVSAQATARVGNNLGLAMAGDGVVTVPMEAPIYAGARFPEGKYVLSYDGDSDVSDDFVAGWTQLDDSIAIGIRAWFDGRVDVLGQNDIPSVPGAEGERNQSYSESYVVPQSSRNTLFVAEWTNDAAIVAVTLQSPTGETFTESDIARDSNMRIVPELASPMRRAILVTGPEAGRWTVTLNSIEELGVADIRASVGTTPPTVEVQDLVGGTERTPVTIGLSVVNASPDATISLYYDRDRRGTDGILLADGIRPTNGSAEYVWDTSDVASGEYYVYAMILDSNNAPVFAYSALPVMVTDDVTPPEAPVVTGVSDDTGLLDDDALTGDSTLLVRGSAEPHSTVRVFRDGTEVGTTVADDRGEWVFDGTDTILSEGDYRFTATATDRWQNISDLSEEYVVTMAYWTNPRLAGDVNGDGLLSPIDALFVITDLSERGARELPVPPSPAEWTSGFVDLNRDRLVTPLDALLAITLLQSRDRGPGEAESLIGRDAGMSSAPRAHRIGHATASGANRRDGNSTFSLTANAPEAPWDFLLSGLRTGIDDAAHVFFYSHYDELAVDMRDEAKHTRQ